MLGFIITRHVNTTNTNHYWKECINQIRRFYPDNIIMVIDDNSNYEFITNTGVELRNCFFIESEYKGRGELLGYYYFYKYKLFDKAVIMHDSVFIQNRIDFESIEKVKFLWHFHHNWDEWKNEKTLLCKLYNPEALLDFYDKTDKWFGCFGVMSVIDYNFLQVLVDKYNLFNLFHFIKNRMDRCNTERVFGLLCTVEYPELVNDTSMFGDLMNCYIPPGITYKKYMEQKGKFDTSVIEIVKVFTGR
jgi:hypothetical protein